MLTTHYLEEADTLADRIAVVDEGQVVALGTPGELKEQIAEAQVTVVEAADMSDEAVGALRQRYPQVTRIEGGVEIEAEGVALYDIEDCLRPMGIAIESIYRKQVSLDDVFLHLTGKQLRE